VYGRKLRLKANFESGQSHLGFKRRLIRAFSLGSDRVWRHKLNLKASLKAVYIILVTSAETTGAFKTEFDAVNQHHRTLGAFWQVLSPGKHRPE